MNKLLIVITILFCSASVLLAQDGDVFGRTMPTGSLLKPTLIVRCVRDLNYAKQPNLKNFWSWMPKLIFSASGPIDDGSFFSYEFFTPDGKLWYTLDSAPFSIGAGEFQKFETEPVPRWNDARSSIATGVFAFKITLKNPLQNTSKVFYQGKFNVKKEFAGTAAADFKNQYVFYVDQDWTLPMAYLNFDAGENPDAPVFRASRWFRGEFNGKIKGYLFYNGKQVTNTEMGGERQVNYVFAEGDSGNKFRWEQWMFTFFNARYFDNKGENGGRHIFKDKPGNYEIKILLDDEVVRVVAFTVGTDGKFIDNNAAKSNGISGFGMLMPAKVNPAKEGAVDLLAYKTGAFYGNGLTGF